jgi:hypothetical protein
MLFYFYFDAPEGVKDAKGTSQRMRSVSRRDLLWYVQVWHLVEGKTPPASDEQLPRTLMVEHDRPLRLGTHSHRTRFTAFESGTED